MIRSEANDKFGARYQPLNVSHHFIIFIGLDEISATIVLYPPFHLNNPCAARRSFIIIGSLKNPRVLVC
jgi:hypothetical protein